MELWQRDALEVTDGEGKILEDLASRVPPECCIVEVGSYRGRSTVFLARGSDRGSKAGIFAVDLWTQGDGFSHLAVGQTLARPYADRETYDSFIEAMAEHGRGLVVPLQGNSVEVAERDGVDDIGLLFIDGSHATKDVRADIRAWGWKVIVGGVMVFHDYGSGLVLNAVRDEVDVEWIEEPSSEPRLGIFRRIGL